MIRDETSKIPGLGRALVVVNMNLPVLTSNFLLTLDLFKSLLVQLRYLELLILQLL